MLSILIMVIAIIKKYKYFCPKNKIYTFTPWKLKIFDRNFIKTLYFSI